MRSINIEISFYISFCDRTSKTIPLIGSGFNRITVCTVRVLYVITDDNLGKKVSHEGHFQFQPIT